MSKSTLCIIFIFCSASISAQLTRPAQFKTRETPQVTLSDIAEFKSNEVVPYSILPHGTDFFLYSYFEQSGGHIELGNGKKLDNLHSLKLYRFDQELRKTGTIDVKWPDEQRDHLSLTSLRNQLLWTFAKKSENKRFYRIEAEVLNAQGNVLSNYKLFNVDKDDFPYLKTYQAHSTNLAFHTRIYANEGAQWFARKKDNEPANLIITVFDSSGALTSLKKARLNCTRKQLEVQSVVVDNEGRVQILAKIYGNAHGSETAGGSDSQIFLYTLNQGSEILERVEMKLDGQYIEGISMVPGEQESTAIVGVYADRMGGRVKGYFSTNNPRTGKLLEARPFSQELLKQLGPRITARNKGELVMEWNFGFRDAIQLSNGMLTILLESFDVHNSKSDAQINSWAIANDRDTYIFGEGVMLTFDQDGVLSETTVVPKLQAAENLGNPFFRVNLVEYKGRPAALYNDNPKNFIRDLSKPTLVSSMKNALAIVCYSDVTGKLQREPVFARSKDEKMVVVPSSAKRLSNNDVVFMALKYKTFGSNTFRFGRL